MIRDALKHPVIFDGRNVYDPAFVTSFGLRYFAIGRGEPLPV
jgi:UDPglucose 6-dehydrogenase